MINGRHSVHFFTMPCTKNYLELFPSDNPEFFLYDNVCSDINAIFILQNGGMQGISKDSSYSEGAYLGDW